VGWVGSDALTEALADAPCGCDLADEAEKLRAREPRGAAVLDADALLAQAAWKCPRTCGNWNPTGLDADHRTALDNVCRLTGLDAEDLRTCPGAYTRTPDAHEAATLLRWLKSSALHLRVPHPTGAQIDALDELQNALNAREADELERLKRKDSDRGQ
jgi:hypothetical protein